MSLQPEDASTSLVTRTPSPSTPAPTPTPTLEKPMLPRLQAAGFVIQKDIWGVKLCRRHFEISAATRDHLRLASTAAEQVGDMVHAAELVQSDDGCGLGGRCRFP
jgi:hypothetical protein